MKRSIFLLLAIFANIYGMNTDEQKKEALDRYQQNQSQSIQIATIGITIYRYPKYDSNSWNRIMDRIKAFENSNFSMASLKETVDFMYEQSLNAEGIWGGASVSYIKDAEKIDGKKQVPEAKK